VRMTVTDARPMASKPHIGLVRCRWEALNQRDEVVLVMEGWNMFRRRADTAS
jgi:acyl dehydratase